MPWWGWILLGAVLLGSETFIEAEFYLVFLGAAALTIGLTLLAGFEQAVWAQWLSFAILSALFLVFFRRRIWQKIADRRGEVRDRVVGEVATLSQRLEPGQQGPAELRGAVWTVRNEGDSVLEAGERVRARELDGLVLLVRRDS